MLILLQRMMFSVTSMCLFIGDRTGASSVIAGVSQGACPTPQLPCHAIVRILRADSIWHAVPGDQEVDTQRPRCQEHTRICKKQGVGLIKLTAVVFPNVK